ncbi:uncharacterized protein LOC128238616 [Mya arenaria]|uniref:uncharacterized protein LOC128238616 n=1 Tax=Mya arenaria TaxID=6604 RepID=UPI0022E4F76A|nr:uncharacterized protein LOC128238616 [Mya arenaria]XP_052810680.1 uncharacterized protein LOC128238616 [Mya arenaria]XP_052810681.1 uncharacterized protein LOC128238616 [Mya arenaria]XP_052810682.1 uncharacterized protein LOC128238616 [Mya arenaria]
MLKHRVSNAGQHGAAAAAAKTALGNQTQPPPNSKVASDPMPPFQPTGCSSDTMPGHPQIGHVSNMEPGHNPTGQASKTIPGHTPIGYASNTTQGHNPIGHASNTVSGHSLAYSTARGTVSGHTTGNSQTYSASGTESGQSQAYDISNASARNEFATPVHTTSNTGRIPVLQNSNDYSSGYHVSSQMCNSGNEGIQNASGVGEYQQQYNTKYAYPEQVGDANLGQEQSATGQNISVANQSKVPLIITTASTAKEGVRIIDEKYDSLGHLSASPTKSPLGSPLSDGGQFSFTDIVMSQKFRDGVNEQDLLQVDTFYRSHKSEVFVCGCLANLYFGSTKASVSNDQWSFSSTGIPLLLLNSGEHHRERKLFIILAEKGTGFTLWRDVIDNLTSYKTPNVNFHTMHLSKDHTKLAGLSFDDAGKAKEFYGHLEKLTADPDDDLLKIGGSKKKKSVKDKKKKIKLPKKTEISQPCCFVHVTKLDRPVSESDLTTHTKGTSNEISAPFNFQHVTGTPGNEPHSLSGSLPNIMGSKLTLTSTNSIDSGLSDDRTSSRTSKS